jgi:hypothetical protein
MTAHALDHLARVLPSLAEVDAELARRLTTAAIDKEVTARGLVLMKMTMAQHGRHPGQLFACSERVAEGYAIFGSAIRVTTA